RQGVDLIDHWAVVGDEEVNARQTFTIERLEGLNREFLDSFGGLFIKGRWDSRRDRVIEVLGIKTVEALFGIFRAVELRWHRGHEFAVRVFQHANFYFRAGKLCLDDNLLIESCCLSDCGGQFFPGADFGHTNRGATTRGFYEDGKAQVRL